MTCFCHSGAGFAKKVFSVSIEKEEVNPKCSVWQAKGLE